MRLDNKRIWLIAMALMMIIGLCHTTSAFADGTHPRYSRLVEWPARLPPRGTVIDLETSVGRFRMPIDYVADPLLLNIEETWTDPDGRHVYRQDEMAFKFIMPTGAVSNNKIRWFSADDAAGRPDPDPAKYVVWFFQAKRGVAGRLVPLDSPKDVLTEGLEPSMSGQILRGYSGRTDLPAAQGQAEVALHNCFMDNCAGYFFFSSKAHVDSSQRRVLAVIQLDRVIHIIIRV